MGRTLPTECVHGRVLDWGDFGDDQPEGCATACLGLTDAAETVLDLAGKLAQRDAEIAHLRDAFHAHRQLIHSTVPDDVVFDSVERLYAAFEETP
jgi:hypothetical protein